MSYVLKYLFEFYRWAMNEKAGKLREVLIMFTVVTNNYENIYVCIFRPEGSRMGFHGFTFTTTFTTSTIYLHSSEIRSRLNEKS